jgi:hypothetical protein
MTLLHSAIQEFGEKITFTILAQSPIPYQGHMTRFFHTLAIVQWGREWLLLPLRQVHGGRVLTVLWLGTAISVITAQAEMPAPGPPSISPLRYTEDYSYLRESTNRSGSWWERFKYIPLGADGWAYLTFGDEVRLRYEHYWNNQFGLGDNSTEGYMRFRELPYADLHLGPSIRVFGQLQNAWAVRDHKNPFVDETGVDLVQAFADWRLSFGEDNSVTFRGGRQLLFYGSGRLINQGPNIRQSFDGGWGELALGHWLVDAFYTWPVAPELNSFDDKPDDQRRLWALYSTYIFNEEHHRGIDLFYIGYENKMAKFNQGEGFERRHSFGTRAFGSNGPWYADTEWVFQAGEFAGGDIRAWSVANQARYTFWDLPFNPWLGLRADVISGDGNPNDHTLETFNPMFPRGGYFGENAVIGPFNLIDLHPAVGMDFGSGWSLTLGGTFYWRANVHDELYELGGGLTRGDNGSRARYMGTQADAVLGWAVNRNLSFNVAYSGLTPGRYIEETGPAKVVHFFGTHLLFGF